MFTSTRREFLQASVIVGGSLAVGGASAMAARLTRVPHDEMRVLILGGTGFLGPQIVEAARAAGHSITLFNRGKTRPHLFPELEKLQGDRNGNLKSLEGRSWDVVIDTSGYVPRQVRDSAGLLAEKVKQYIFVSTMSVYAENATVGMNESAPVGKLANPDDEDYLNPENYGPLKALCEQAAEEAMPGRVTNVRPGLIVGPGDFSDRFTYWPVRVAKGGEVLAPGSPKDPVQFIDCRDLGEWLVHLGEKNIRGVFNAIGPDRVLTIGELLDSCKQVAASDAKFTWVNAAFLEAQGVSAWMDMPVWIPPEGDSAGFHRRTPAKAVAAGLKYRAVTDTCKATLDWHKTLPVERRAHARAGLTSEREAAVLAAWHASRVGKGGGDK